MIEYKTIRNKAQLKEHMDQLATKRLPLNVAVEEVQQVRSLDLNNYLWLIYTIIAEDIGQSPEEVHEAYKLKFRFRGNFRYNKKLDRYEYIVETQSTSSAGQYDLWEYTMKVRADGEIELHLTLPMPNEVFITDELSFNNEKS